MSLRAFHEGEDKVFRVSPVKVLDGNLKFLVDVAEDDARRAAQDPKRIVFCPPLCTFRERKGAGEADLVEGLTLSVEVDQNPEAARAKLEPLLGPATVAVRSGGIWQSNGTAYDKMHLHWRLAEPAQGKEQLAKLKRAREIAAHLVGADPTTVPICHPMRWAGSWHRKAEPRPCEIIPSASNFDHEIDLDEALAKLEPFAPAPAPSSGNGAAPPQPGGDWDVLVANILRGEGLHKSITRLAMKLLASGMSEPAAVNHLRALMVQSQAPRDERWQKRFEYIPRAVRSAAKKLAKSEEPAPEQPKQPTPDPQPLAAVHALFRRWLGEDYDLAMLDAGLAAAAAERLTGDPLWLLVISGSGNAKTETVQALGGSGRDGDQHDCVGGCAAVGNPVQQKEQVRDRWTAAQDRRPWRAGHQGRDRILSADRNVRAACSPPSAKSMTASGSEMSVPTAARP